MPSDSSHFFRLHSRFGRVLTVIVIAGSLTVLVLVAAGGQLAEAAALTPMLGLLGYLTWAGFWRPAVLAGPAGVTLRNVWHTTEVAWPEIQRIDTKYALTLYTVHGKVTAWAAPAPDRHVVLGAVKSDGGHLPESTYLDGTVRPGDLITTDSGQAAYAIRAHWERLRDEGHLADARSEFPKLRRHWHWASLAIAGGLTAVTVLSALL